MEEQDRNDRGASDKKTMEEYIQEATPDWQLNPEFWKE